MRQEQYLDIMLFHVSQNNKFVKFWEFFSVTLFVVLAGIVLASSICWLGMCSSSIPRKGKLTPVNVDVFNTNGSMLRGVTGRIE